MVWDRIKKAGQSGLGAVKSLGDQVNKAAQGTVDAAAAVKNGSLGLLNATGNNVMQAGDFALKTVEGGYVRVSSTVQDTISGLDDGLHSARNAIANNMKQTIGSVSGGFGAAGEVAVMGGLLSAGGVGIVAYPFVAGEADRLIKKAAGGVSDPLVNAIRSKRPEFLDTFTIDNNLIDGLFDNRPADVMGMIYMPRHEGADSDGIVLFTEEALFHLTRSNQPAREAKLYQSALDAVIQKKQQCGIEPLRPILIREAIAIGQARKNGMEL